MEVIVCLDGTGFEVRMGMGTYIAERNRGCRPKACAYFYAAASPHIIIEPSKHFKDSLLASRFLVYFVCFGDLYLSSIHSATFKCKALF